MKNKKTKSGSTKDILTNEFLNPSGFKSIKGKTVNDEIRLTVYKN